MAGVDADRELIARDYVPSGRRARNHEQVTTDLRELSATDLLDLTLVARSMGFGATPEALDIAASPRGYRLLARVPRLPPIILGRIVEHFAGLQKLLAASVEDLQNVEGVGEGRARSVREAISRLADASIIDRYP
jgi:diadenylate cyclase